MLFFISRGCIQKASVRRNRVEAVRLWDMAGDRGHAYARYQVARAYKNGKGAGQNLQEAQRQFRLLAEQDVTLGSIS